MDAHFLERYELPDAIKELTARSCRCFDLQPCMNRPHSMGEIYIDKWHLSGKGYSLIAKSIYDCFLSRITAREPLDLNQLAAACNKTFIDMVKRIYNENQSIGEWLEEVGKQAFQTEGTIGAIVMNCNPFTVGHRYVIEQALNEVSSLYIFVVEEDRSDFSFSDRLELIQQGTADLGDRVRVLPSGKFIISSFTFPEYFEKTQLTTVKIDPSAGVCIFGAIIAPKLKITFRFIGEEPFCNITNQYNATMKRLLPHMGVTVREMPRYAVNHEPVSASRVRGCLKYGDVETLRSLVPPTTFTFLLQQMSEQKNIIFESKTVIHCADKKEIVLSLKLYCRAIKKLV